MYDLVLNNLISETVPTITVDELKEIESDEILILDTREKQEFR